MNFRTNTRTDDVINGVFVCVVLVSALSLSLDALGVQWTHAPAAATTVVSSAHTKIDALVALR